MSDMIEDLLAVLHPLTTGGAWYGTCTTDPSPSEYIVCLRVASTVNASLSGPSDLQNTRVQIDIYARTVARVAAIEAALEAAMADCAITNVPLASQDVYEPDTRLYRVMKDYSLWTRN